MKNILEIYGELISTVIGGVYVTIMLGITITKMTECVKNVIEILLL